MGYNMRNEKISVCMATYNGDIYLKKQLDSILYQLVDGDELIIVDDKSIDNTVKIIMSYNDPKIKLYINEYNCGVNRSFEKAISLAHNDFIFLSDQDDIWTKNRVLTMLNILINTNIAVVCGNSLYIDKNDNEIEFNIPPLYESDSNFIFRNLFKIFIGKGSYFGCAMAFKREFIKYILPFPKYIESHDLWIVKASILQNRCYHLNKIVLFRRIHGNNASVLRRRLFKKIISRLIFVISIIDLKIRECVK